MRSHASQLLSAQPVVRLPASIVDASPQRCKRECLQGPRPPPGNRSTGLRTPRPPCSNSWVGARAAPAPSGCRIPPPIGGSRKSAARDGRWPAWRSPTAAPPAPSPAAPPSQRLRKHDGPRPCRQVRLVPRPYPLQMIPQQRTRRLRHHRDPVLLPLPPPHPDLAPPPVHILDPQRQALQQPQPAAMQRQPRQVVHPRQLRQHPTHLRPVQHHRDPRHPPPPRHQPGHLQRPTQHLPIEKAQRRQRLRLGRCGRQRWKRTNRRTQLT